MSELKLFGKTICFPSDSDQEVSREPCIDEQEDAASPQKDSKTLKKPDKILPCPRCKSMDTKFFYYNNYNAMQPRHFCKNCQRYWTAGGTMRNVPVGAGRRKTNNPTVKDSGDDRSSITPSNSSDKVPNSRLHEDTLKNYQVPWFTGSPWPCASWNSTLHPVSFYPAPTYWNMPHASPSSTVLGKHLREEPEKESNNSIWVPKTLRIDDPSEAAKSSIRATFGIWNEKTSCMSGGGLFESFQSMGASAPLHANPAALSRSLKFQETT